MAQNASSSAFFLQEPQISRHASTSRIIAEIDVAGEPTSQSEECCGIVRLRSLEERSARCVLRLRDGSAVSKNPIREQLGRSGVREIALAAGYGAAVPAAHSQLPG